MPIPTKLMNRKLRALLVKKAKQLREEVANYLLEFTLGFLIDI